MATTSRAPRSYGEGMDQARALIARGRLADPDEHFPYKRAAVQDLIDEDPPMGPGVPDGTDGSEDRSREVADYMTPEIADASADYIEAQQAYLDDPNGDTKDAYSAAKDRLEAARLDHRTRRGNGFTVGAAARRSR